MTTEKTYTHEQLSEARFAAQDAAGKLVGPEYVKVWGDTFAAYLDLPLAPEKPAPGTIGVTHQGWPAYVSVDGVWMAIHPGGYPLRVHRNDPQPQPARVVPAAPVKLTEEQVGELWDGRHLRINNWADLTTAKRGETTDTVNAALAKHGHAAPVELPTREKVYGALRDSWLDWTCGDASDEVGDPPASAEKSLNWHTDAVMALFPGGGTDA